MRQRKGAAGTSGSTAAEAAEAPKKKPGLLRKMAVRSAAAVGMYVVSRAIVNQGHIAVCATILITQIGMFYELVNIRYKEEIESKKLPLFRALQWVWFAVAMTAAYGSSWLRAPMGAGRLNEYVHEHLPQHVTDEHWLFRFVSFCAYSAAFCMTVLSFRPGLYTYQLEQLMWTALSVTIVVGLLKTTIYCVYEGLIWFLFPGSLVVANDTFAYFSGVAFGRKFIKAPFMRLSPNKTWEGFLGAAVLTVLYAVLSAKYWAASAWMRCSYRELVEAGEEGFASLTMGSCSNDHIFMLTGMEEQGAEGSGVDPSSSSLLYFQWIALGLGLFASFVAPFGGFFASAVKRGSEIKDFGSFFPGHGGFVDRCDCQLIMSMAAWATYTTFVSNPHLILPYGRVLEAALALSQEERLQLAEALRQ